MTDTSHLDALRLRLSHERGYLAAAKTDRERELRAVWISQIEREIAAELDHLGKAAPVDADMTDDELLAELLG